MDLLTKIGRTLTKEDYKKLFEEGLFVFDTNVLLDLYRLPHEAKEDLFRILESKQLKNRVWLPFQVHLEYVYNKNGEIRGQNTKFDVVSAKVNEFQNEIHKLAASIKDEIDELNLKKRHSSIEAEKYINDELFKASIDKLDNFKEELSELKKKQPDIADRDKIGDRIATIFKNKVGKSFDKAKLQDIYKKGADRYKNKIPPGYKDDIPKKDGSHFYEDKEYIRKFGDLILWKEIIEKAKSDKELKYLVFISSDLKEDWRDKHNAVRYELLNEIYYAANQLKIFHIYDSSNFMKYAKEYLNLEVSDESIKEAKGIHSNTLENSVNIINLIARTANELNVDLSFKIEDNFSPYLKISKAALLDLFIIDLLHDTRAKFHLPGRFIVSISKSGSGLKFIHLDIEILADSLDSMGTFSNYAVKEYSKKYSDLAVFTFRKQYEDANSISLTIGLTLIM